MEAKSDRARSVIIDLSRRYGGASTRAITLASGLAEWQAAIATLEGSPVAEAARARGIRLVTVGRSRGDPRIAFRLAAAARRGGFEILDTQNIQSQFWGSLAALMCKAALVSTLNSSYAGEHGGNWKGRGYQFLQGLTRPMTRRYIAVSRSIHDELCRSGIAEDKIDLIHNAVEIAIPSAGTARQDVRAALGLPPDATLCTAVGRLVWAKGYADLIDAFALVANDLGKVYCVIVGDGELREALQQQINRAGLSKRILLTGYREREQALAILGASDVFVMPSRSEGIPYALLEAGAMGLPILATTCGGIPEVVRDGAEGILVPPADPRALGAALKALCSDLQQARRLGNAARHRIEDEFSVQVLIAATQQAYLKAVAGSRRASEQLS